MDSHKVYNTINVLDVEARARKLRAQALARGAGAFGRWVASPFSRG